MADPVLLRLADALAALPGPAGARFTTVMQRGTLEVEVYAPRGKDLQTPHARDELYLVVAGRGRFRCGGQVVVFEPGDGLFAAAGVEHRFEDFSDDLVVWVIFYGPDGGERPA